MFYGSLKFKKNWLGKRVWYANYLINDEIVWKKIKPEQIETLLIECGSNRFVSTEFVMGQNVRHNNINVIVTVENNNVYIKSPVVHGLSLPLHIYDSATYKIKCNSRELDFCCL